MKPYQIYVAPYTPYDSIDVRDCHNTILGQISDNFVLKVQEGDTIFQKLNGVETSRFTQGGNWTMNGNLTVSGSLNNGVIYLFQLVLELLTGKSDF